jgi:hypothetical protein
MAINVRNPIWVQALSAPGAHAFAMLFAIDSVTRATLATIVPLQLFAVTGSPTLLSIIYFGISVTGLLTNFLIAPLTGMPSPCRALTASRAITTSRRGWDWPTTSSATARPRSR